MRLGDHVGELWLLKVDLSLLSTPLAPPHLPLHQIILLVLLRFIGQLSVPLRVIPLAQTQAVEVDLLRV